MAVPFPGEISRKSINEILAPRTHSRNENKFFYGNADPTQWNVVWLVNRNPSELCQHGVNGAGVQVRNGDLSTTNTTTMMTKYFN